MSSCQITGLGRLNAGDDGAGTIPREADYANFTRHCANFVRRSPRCSIWIIGNEPTHPIEWSGGESGGKSRFAAMRNAIAWYVMPFAACPEGPATRSSPSG